MIIDSSFDDEIIYNEDVIIYNKRCVEVLIFFSVWSFKFCFVRSIFGLLIMVATRRTVLAIFVLAVMSLIMVIRTLSFQQC
jgi:hypothetical protein